MREGADQAIGIARMTQFCRGPQLTSTKFGLRRLKITIMF